MTTKRTDACRTRVVIALALTGMLAAPIALFGRSKINPTDGPAGEAAAPARDFSTPPDDRAAPPLKAAAGDALADSSPPKPGETSQEPSKPPPPQPPPPQ